MSGGRVLAGRYRLDELLGQGGMGEVWRARDMRLNRVVAVKLVLPEGRGDHELLVRLLREAENAAAVDHPGATMIHDVGEHDGVPFLVMEFLRGEDLKAVVDRHPSGLPLETVVSAVGQVAETLAVAHAQGVIHRDVKPANLVLLPDGRVKVCDFGISRFTGATAGLTGGRNLGTPFYMAPEQFRDEPLDGRTDLYALGGVLYTLLTGRPPFTAQSMAALMYQHLDTVPVPPRELRPEIPPELDALVQQLLAKKRDDRPRDATEVCRRLKGVGLWAVPEPVKEAVPPQEQAVVVRPREPSPVTVSPLHVLKAPPPARRWLAPLAAVAGVGVLAVTVPLVWDANSNGSGDKAVSNASPVYGSANSTLVNPSGRKGGTLRLALSSDFDSTDPGDTYMASQWNFSRLYARPLVTFKAAPGSANLELVPDLAESLGTQSEDGKTWTYKIRSGIKYDDGTTVTSKDVKYAVERSNYSKELQLGPKYFQQYLKDNPGGYKGPYLDKSDTGLQSIETPDDQTIVFHLTAPFAEFDYLASMPQTAPVPKSKDTVLKYQTSIASTGPYRFDSYETGRSLVLSRNPNWDAATDPLRKALPDKITVQIGQASDEIDSRLMSGALDLDLGGTGVQAAAQAKILGIPDLKKNSDLAPGSTLSYFALNQKVPPLDNVHCRKAVAYATDKAAVQDAFGGPVSGGQIATTIIPPTVSGYVKQDLYPSGADGHGDLVKAKDELALCGKREGFSTVMSARSDRPKEMQMEQGVQKRLAEVGIKVTFKNSPFSEFTTTQASPEYVHKNGIGIIFSRWSPDWPSGYSFLQQIVDSRAIRPSSNLNYQETRIPAVDEMLDQSTKERDGTARAKLYARIDQAVMADANIVPLLNSSHLLYRPDSITNVMVNAAYYGMYDYMNMGVKH